VHTELSGKLACWPAPCDGAVGQVGPQGGKAQRGDAGCELLVSGVAALAGAAQRPRGAVDAGLVNEAADDVDGGVEFAGQLREAGVCLAARLQVVLQVSEAQASGLLVEASLLAVGDGEAAAEDQTARQMCWLGCCPCARSAGSPTTPGDPPSPRQQHSERSFDPARPSAWETPRAARVSTL